MCPYPKVRGEDARQLYLGGPSDSWFHVSVSMTGNC